MNVNLYIIEDYENETALRPKKTNPNKANVGKSGHTLKAKGGAFLLIFRSQKHIMSVCSAQTEVAVFL